MLALLSSMPFELSLIPPLLKNRRSYKVAGKTAVKGTLSTLPIILVYTGIGKVNAAHSVTCILERLPVEIIINIGVGGAYPNSGLRVGDIAAASKEIYGDEGVLTPQGFKGMEEIGIPLVKAGKKKYFNEFPVLVPPLMVNGEGAVKIKTGNFVTVSAVTGSQKRAKELEKRFDALCENMEGAAIAQICALYKVPMVEIRGISNIAGIRDKGCWNLTLAAQNCQRAALDVMNSPLIRSALRKTGKYTNK